MAPKLKQVKSPGFAGKTSSCAARLAFGSGVREQDEKSQAADPAMRDGSQGAEGGQARTRRGGQGEAVDGGAPCQLLLSVVIGNFPGRGVLDVGNRGEKRENSENWGAYMQ